MRDERWLKIYITLSNDYPEIIQNFLFNYGFWIDEETILSKMTDLFRAECDEPTTFNDKFFDTVNKFDKWVQKTFINSEKFNIDDYRDYISSN